MAMTKILFVCMGNICRSPTAHGVMQAKVTERGLAKRFHIESAGTHAYHVGEKSDPRSRQAAAQRGVDMEFIRAQKISILDYDEYDYILAMDHDNLELVNYYAPQGHQAEVALFLSYANQAGLIDELVVPDPYYGGESGFEQVFDLVDKGCDALLEHILDA
ncbi:low molecular weight protein-tyrosine-phosphatase [Arenicella xantha]|uniref:protein-tyrosine-phosphatase n=1 Tax=Arenicella xantha TaxID=644221 RepID=A0A395JLU7_9GAMM|nr:low molecular weight protein-tyrosine-phosphatase [Arenicella xantha]RBP50827.1 protein-tyrosine phosphatase [Arenicella xantha]